MAVKVPAKVLDGIDAVRDSGKTNMLDSRAVQFYANKMEHYETVLWIEDNRSEYGRGIFEGFEAED